MYLDFYLKNLVEMSFIQDELSEIPQKLKSIPHTELITCHPSMVQIKVRLVLRVLDKNVVLARFLVSWGV